MSSPIAVDIAVLLPPSAAQAAIDCSARLPRAESLGLQLGPECLPHITLTQQFVEASALGPIAGAIAEIVSGRDPLRVRITGGGQGSHSVWMEVERSVALFELHRAMMDALRPFEESSGGIAAFVGGDARSRDIDWVAGFRRQSSYERFRPHITIGHASAVPPIEPMAFDADVVAICHLGRFCTCRHVLWSGHLSAGAPGHPARPDTHRPSGSPT